VTSRSTRRPIAACPGPRARGSSGGVVTARHLTPARSAARHASSTRRTCGHGAVCPYPRCHGHKEAPLFHLLAPRSPPRLSSAPPSPPRALPRRPRTSPSHELGTTATGRRSPCRSPPATAHHRGGPYPGEFLGPNAPFPRCPHRRRPPESTGAAASPRNGSSSPVLPVGCQPETSRPSCWTGPKQQWVSAHVHSSISYFLRFNLKF
jgi:hypothetical protein